MTANLSGSDADAQMEFWHTLASRNLTSNDEAFHGLLLFLDAEDPAERTFCESGGGPFGRMYGSLGVTFAELRVGGRSAVAAVMHPRRTWRSTPSRSLRSWSLRSSQW